MKSPPPPPPGPSPSSPPQPLPAQPFGATATNATGVRNAFLVANNLVNVATGLAGGASLPTAATLESAKLYTLADVLAVCINSNGGSACNPLFSAAIQGFTPTNTLDAALNIVRNPGLNVAAVYNANNAQGPFQPTLTTVPNDWTMSITYTGGGLYAPTALGIDSTGSIWAANYFGGVASKLSASGIPASANGFADSNLYESYGLAIDTADNAWITVEETSGSVNSGDGSITKFSSTGTLLSGSGYTAGGIYYPYAIAADSNGQMWVADFGRSSATLLANDGTSASGTAGYTPTGLSFPTSVALDGSHNAFFGVQGSAVKVTPAGVGTIYTCCKSPAGVALDPRRRRLDRRLLRLRHRRAQPHRSPLPDPHRHRRHPVSRVRHHRRRRPRLGHPTTVATHHQRLHPLRRLRHPPLTLHRLRRRRQTQPTLRPRHRFRRQPLGLQLRR